MPGGALLESNLPPIPSARDMKKAYVPHGQKPKIGPKPPPRRPRADVHPQYLSKHHRRMAAALKEGPEVLMNTRLWDDPVAGASCHMTCGCSLRFQCVY